MFLLLLAVVAATPSPPANNVGRTMAPLNLFVDPLGNDNNACLGTGATACATPQGAINKIPKSLRHGATVTLPAGSFPSFSVSGFALDQGLQQDTSGVLIKGTLTNSTLASGPVTGTLTAASGGSALTYATLTDSGANWTTNDLKGRIIVITSGTGAGHERLILSNTSTVITLTGTISSAVPTAGSGYAIRDHATTVNTCGFFPATPGAAKNTTFTYGVRVSGNNGIVIRLVNLKLQPSSACNFGVYQFDPAAVLSLERVRLDTNAGTASHLAYAGALAVNDVHSIYSSTTGSHVTGGGIVSSATSTPGVVQNPSGLSSSAGTIQNSLFENGATGLNLLNFRPNLFGLILQNIQTTGISLGSSVNFQGVTISCTANASAVGVLLQTTAGNNGSVSLEHSAISGCATAVSVSGSGVMINTLNAVTATGATFGLKVSNGGLVITNSSPTFSASSAELQLDGSVTGTLSGIGSGTCLTGIAGYGSRICKL